MWRTGGSAVLRELLLCAFVYVFSNRQRILQTDKVGSDDLVTLNRHMRTWKAYMPSDKRAARRCIVCFL